MSYAFLYQIVQGLSMFLRIVRYILLAYCLMSWFVRPTNRFYQICQRMCDPLLAPFRPISRKLIEKGFMIDISAILAFFALDIVERLIWWLFTRLL